jgi:hypothetical protein
MEIVMTSIFAVLFLAVGIFILIGKGDRFVKPLNRPGAERYNVKRIRLLHALMMFSGSMCFVSFAIFMQNVKLIQILGGVFVFVAAILVVLQYTWAKNR